MTSHSSQSQIPAKTIRFNTVAAGPSPLGLSPRIYQQPKFVRFDLKTYDQPHSSYAGTANHVEFNFQPTEPLRHVSFDLRGSQPPRASQPLAIFETDPCAGQKFAWFSLGPNYFPRIPGDGLRSSWSSYSSRYSYQIQARSYYPVEEMSHNYPHRECRYNPDRGYCGNYWYHRGNGNMWGRVNYWS
ncbi:hypothetical protein K470DRAFT_74531 [Piedraia hortae CBS 480.64]|uniref:Uncharacterized protein n=1 Tax=Piedraia hortae CBS 480.64 TaxID=1314780 RepID=A0A6A7BYQ0_9PEZI|nr:hypothetical protein K470DRAFT_74531 [Piedraia hortae CBS 480.64]